MSMHKLPAPMTFATADEWSAWLSVKHDKARDLWLRIGKKGSGTVSIDWEQAVEEALVWGWTTAQKKPDGPDHWLHRFTPRKPGSPWTPKDRATAERLIAGGWIEDAGLAEVERAKADGRWAAAAPGEKPVDIPDDFLTALQAAPGVATATFNTLPATARAALAFRLTTAKTPSARTRRIAEYIATLGRGEKP